MLTRDINSACNCVLHCYIMITSVNASRNINKEFKRQTYGDNSLGDKIFDTFLLRRSSTALTHASLPERNWITFDCSRSLSCSQEPQISATYTHRFRRPHSRTFLSAPQTKTLTHRVIKLCRMFKRSRIKFSLRFSENSVKERAGSEQCDDLRWLINKVSLCKFVKI